MRIFKCAHLSTIKRIIFTSKYFNSRSYWVKSWEIRILLLVKRFFCILLSAYNIQKHTILFTTNVNLVPHCLIYPKFSNKVFTSYRLKIKSSDLNYLMSRKKVIFSPSYVFVSQNYYQTGHANKLKTKNYMV